MESAFAPQLPFEMFHCIRHIHLSSVDSRFLESAIHNLTGWTDKRFSGDIFVIARLFSDEHNARGFRSFAKYCLGCMFV
jgi:hypothetical protein